MTQFGSPYRGLVYPFAAGELEEFLAEARLVPDAVLYMTGDDGGNTYLSVAPALVKATPSALARLLHDLDVMYWPWNRGDSAAIHYEGPPPGGPFTFRKMGSLLDGIRVNTRFDDWGISHEIRDIVLGRAAPIRTRLVPIYIVLRADMMVKGGTEVPVRAHVDAIKIVRTKSEAESEIARLDIIAGADTEYFFMESRIDVDMLTGARFGEDRRSVE